MSTAMASLVTQTSPKCLVCIQPFAFAPSSTSSASYHVYCGSMESRTQSLARGGKFSKLKKSPKLIAREAVQLKGVVANRVAPHVQPRAACRATVEMFSSSKDEAARKALAAAFADSSRFKKFDEEAKLREKRAMEESSGGGGGWGGNGGFWKRWRWGGGGSGGGGGSFDAEEGKQVALALSGVILLFIMMSQGGQILALALNCILFVLRGGKWPSSSSAAMATSTGSAEDDVKRKWGSD